MLEKEWRKELRYIASTYGAKVIFRSFKVDRYGVFFKGTYSHKKRRISINNLISDPDEAISILFHEIGHLICHEKGLFWYYHNLSEFITIESFKKYKRTALRAERFVDKMGKTMAQKYLPDINYIPGYQDKIIAKCFRDDLNRFEKTIREYEEYQNRKKS